MRFRYAAKFRQINEGGGVVASLDALKEESEGEFEPATLSITALSPLELIELSHLLQKALSELEPLTQNLLRDFLVHQIPYKELALKYKIPMGTVGVNLTRGLKKIRAGLEQNPKLLKEIRAHLR